MAMTSGVVGRGAVSLLQCGSKGGREASGRVEEARDVAMECTTWNMALLKHGRRSLQDKKQ